MRRIAFFLLALAVCFSLAACAAQEQTDSGSSAAENSLSTSSAVEQLGDITTSVQGSRSTTALPQTDASATVSTAARPWATAGANKTKNTTGGSITVSAPTASTTTSNSTASATQVSGSKWIYDKPTRTKKVSEAFQAKQFVSSDGYTLPYRIYIPDGYTEQGQYPVLLFLHGAGERGNDNASQLNNMLQRLFYNKLSVIYGAIIVCPQCPSGEQWVNTPWGNGNYVFADMPISRAMASVIELVKSLEKDYATDRDRYYVMGLSMGGFGTWDILMREPHLFAAAVPICGGGDPQMAAVLARLPIRTYHGAKDPTVPVRATREMVEAIEKRGGNIYYEEIADGYHDVWDHAAEDPQLIPWLFAQGFEG